MMHYNIKNIAENFIRETRTFEKMNPSIEQKEFISAIRNKQI